MAAGRRGRACYAAGAGAADGHAWPAGRGDDAAARRDHRQIESCQAFAFVAYVAARAHALFDFWL
jgi:hypothetical protein